MKKFRKALWLTLKIFLLLLLLVTAALFFHYYRQDKQALAELDALLKDAQQENQTCAAYGKETKQIFQDMDKRWDKKTHDSKAEALLALKLLEKNPGWGPHNAAAADYFFDNGYALARNLHQLGLLQRSLQIESFCEIISFMKQAEFLIRDLKKYHFTKSEQNRVDALVKRFLTGEPRFRTLIEALIKAHILQVYVENLPADKLPPHLVFAVHALNGEGEERRARLWDTIKNHRWDLFSAGPRSFERRMVQEFYRSYYPLAQAALQASSPAP